MLVGLEAFDVAVKGWLKDVEKEAEEAAVGLATLVFEQVLKESPQYSGSYAANWKISYGTLVPYAEVDPLNTKGQIPPPYARGSEPAQTYAKAYRERAEGGFKLGQSVFVHNSTVSPAESAGGTDVNLAWEIENGTIKFRPINQGADHVGARSLNFVAHRYAVINKSTLTILRMVGV